MIINNISIKKNLIYILLSFIILIGFNIIKDYGIGIEEHFQRKSGFYWLNFILSFLSFDTLSNQVVEKIREIELFTPNLPQIKNVPYYGVIFDLPLAFIEIFFKINNSQDYFLIRHVTIFLIFLLSAFVFYKIILNRFENYYLANFGFLLYVFSPRIFGNIFFDNKDILFLSIITFTFYFFLKYIKNNSFQNLIYLALFCALSTSTRIIGILIPISFIFIILIKLLNDEKIAYNLKIIIYFTFFTVFFLFIHWPYLWTLTLENWFNFFTPFFQAMNPIVFFNGEFYQSKYLPISYLPLWIILTTPLFILALFFFGFIIGMIRFSARFIKANNFSKKYLYDLWASKNEYFDLIIMINFLLVILLYFSVNLALLAGWRHFYFLNFFLSYYACFSIFIFLTKFRKNNYKKKILLSILSVCLLVQFFDIYKYHPYQSVYFNNIVPKYVKNNFEIDTLSLSRVDAIKEILNDDSKNLIIGTASWTPLEDARSLIPKSKWERMSFVGTNFEKADYIYSNHYYEVDTNYNKKYKIPENFYLYKRLIIDDTRIYSIYKNKK